MSKPKLILKRKIKKKVFISVKSDTNKHTDKLVLDQYYTPKATVNDCVNYLVDTINLEDVKQLVEPSAGTGVFVDVLKTLNIDVLAFDIEPKRSDIECQDFLESNLAYKKGRCFVGNPPFGERLNLATKFYKKCTTLGDYIAFILPISQLNNNQTLYEFDLIQSIDLGKVLFSNRKEVHCCFNIYQRPQGELNPKPKTKLKDVTIIRQDKQGYDKLPYDLRMCYWGNGSAGKILTDPNEHYSGEYKIQIHNSELKPKIIKVLSEVDWKEEIKSTAMLRIKQYHIIQVLQKYVDTIE